MGAVEQRAEGGIGVKTAAVMRMIRGFVATVSQKQPEMLDPTLRNVASAVGQLTPEMIMGLLNEDAAGSIRGGTTEDRVMDAVVSHMSDRAIAGFVSRNVMSDGTPTDRLAQAFQALVNDTNERERLLTMAKDDVAASPLGSTEGFDDVWSHVAQKLLTSYSDKDYISEPYARELSSARAHAIDVEKVSDDPPERITGWLTTVSTTAVRTLDISLLLDLLRIEETDNRWGELMTPVVHTLEDLLLVGDFDSALGLIDVIAKAASRDGTKERRQHAMIAIDMIVAGPMMQHIVIHLASVDDTQFERIKTMCLSLGEVLVRPLAEALATEQRGRTRERLTGRAAGVRRGRAAHDRATEELDECRRPPHRDPADAPVRRQRRIARPHRAARRQRASGAARSRARDSDDRHRQGVSGAATGAGDRQRAIAQRHHAVDQLRARRTGDAAGRIHPAECRSPQADDRVSARYRAARRTQGRRSGAAARRGVQTFRANGGRPRRNADHSSRRRRRHSRASAPPTRSPILEEAVANWPRSLRSVARPHLQKRRPAQGTV